MKKRMKHTLFATLMALAFVLQSCTQNDGRIGPLFGTWRLDSIERLDNAETLMPPHDLTWSFQSDVVCMKELLPYHGQNEYWGSWRLDGTTLELFYDNHDDEIGSMSPPYTLPSGYGFDAAPTTLRFSVTELSGSRMTLEYVDSTASTLRYTLTKIL